MSKVTMRKDWVRGVRCGGSGAGPHEGNRRIYILTTGASKISPGASIYECAGCGQTWNAATVAGVQESGDGDAVRLSMWPE